MLPPPLPPSPPMQLFLCRLQVLYFYDESGRAPFVRHLRQAASDLGREMRVTEMREEELLKEATTREQRAQIVETFIRHAFSKVQSVAFKPLQKKMSSGIMDFPS